MSDSCRGAVAEDDVRPSDRPGAGRGRQLHPHPAELVGREQELAALRRALLSAVVGGGSSLVLRGEVGTGKSLLLERAVTDAEEQGFRVWRTEATKSEAHLAYAGLHQLLRPLLAAVETLPAPLSSALGSVVGLADGNSPNKFLVHLAALKLLSDAAVDRPLLCVVDDAHWLDGESLETLNFVARRVAADRIVLLFAVLPFTGRSAEFDGLDRLDIAELAEPEAVALLRRTLDGAVSGNIVRTVVARIGGNPLALSTIGHELSPMDVRRHANQPEPIPLGGSARRFLHQVRELTSECQTLLLLLAAEPTGDVALLRRSAHALGADLGGLLPAVDRGVITIGGSISFCQAVVRSSVYRSASPAARRHVHAVLAAETDHRTTDELRAWHLSAAAERPDEEIAHQLALAAGRLGDRGAWSAQVELLVRASRLSPESDQRSIRLLLAALGAAVSGDHRLAVDLVRELTQRPCDPHTRHEALRLGSWLHISRRRYREAPSRLLDAAFGLDAFNRTESRLAMLDTMVALGRSRDLADSVTAELVAREARRLPLPSGSPVRPTDLLLAGYRTAIERGVVAATPALRESIAEWQRDAPAASQVMRWNVLTVWAALEMWDVGALRSIVERDLHIVRQQRAVGAEKEVLVALATVEIIDGRLEAAGSIHESVRTLHGSGDTYAHECALIECELLAWRGDEDAARRSIAAVRDDSVNRGFGEGIRVADLATAVLANGCGRYEEAAAAAGHVLDDPMPGYVGRALAEFVEAATRIGQIAEAGVATTELRRRADASGSRLALGIAARSEALVAPPGDAEALFESALVHFGETTSVPHLARSHLLFGEWLRRRRRRADARLHLERAHRLLTEVGAGAFATRAQSEVGASGATARRRVDGTAQDLTPRERQVVALARAGSTNGEIASQVFVSVNTVDHHLRSVYRKLGISSRRDLPDLAP